MKKIKRVLNYLYFSGLIIAPIVLLLLPADFFDTGESICLSVVLLDTECLGCGLTRASMHLIHFDFSTAWSYNPIAFIVVPIISFFIIKEVTRIWKGLNLYKRS